MVQINFSIFSEMAEPNATIKVNGEDVVVNKYILALSSSYFERYFFDSRYPPAENIELDPATTVEDFRRMIASLPPEQRLLDDDCIDAVIILADRFYVSNLIETCRNFLMTQSRKPALDKFRIAHKYWWEDLKEQILRSMPLDTSFVQNATAFAMLDDEAKADFAARHAKLVSERQKPPATANFQVARLSRSGLQPVDELIRNLRN